RVALRELLDNATLSRVQNNALKSEKDVPLQVSEIFRALTDSIWNLPKDKEAAKKTWPSTVNRRNLQREYVNSLSNIVLGKGQGFRPLPPDARSLARFHLREIARGIESVSKNEAIEDVTRAHLEESQERIDRILKASMQVTAP